MKIACCERYDLDENSGLLAEEGSRGGDVVSVVSYSANWEWAWASTPDNDIPLPIRCLQEMQSTKQGKAGWEIGGEGFPRFLFFCASDDLLLCGLVA